MSERTGNIIGVIVFFLIIAMHVLLLEVDREMDRKDAIYDGAMKLYRGEK